jgi:hypothetical protein
MLRPPSFATTFGQRASSSICVFQNAKDLILLARVGTASDRTAEMVEHDRRIRERSRETDGVWDLGVCAPDLEAELAGVEMLEASAKIVTEK